MRMSFVDVAVLLISLSMYIAYFHQFRKLQKLIIPTSTQLLYQLY